MLILPHLPKRAWYQTPRGVRIRQRLTARLDDGHVVWRGWFDDREDLDAFLYAMAAGSLHYERELWRLPTPWWHPDLNEGVIYAVDTVTYLTTPTGSNQTYNVPADFDPGKNNTQLIGAGGSGAIDSSGANSANTGGGGGAFSKQTNISLTPGGTAIYQIGTGGPAKLGDDITPTNGVTGGDTWFNGTSMASPPTVGAKGGGAGQTGGSNANGGTGGAAASGFGATKTNGGRGGNATTTGNTGAGGAAGLNGDGNQGVDVAGGGSSNGGSADVGVGGAGGTAPGGTGGNGTEFGSGNGSGGGGAGRASAATNSAGPGGNYGGGGGGNTPGLFGLNATSGAGIQGIIVVTYTPFIPVFAGPDTPRSRRIRMVAY